MNKNQLLRTLILNYTSINDKSLLKILKGGIGGAKCKNITILNYLDINLAFLEEFLLGNNFSVNIINVKSTDVYWVINVLNKKLEDELIYIIGVEQLLFFNKKRITTHCSSFRFNVRNDNDFNLTPLKNYLEMLLEKINSHLLMVLNLTQDITERILEEFKDYDIEIPVLNYHENNKIYYGKNEVLDAINNKSLEEALLKIDEQKSVFAEETIRQQKIAAFLKNDYIDKAYEILLENYNDLESSEKIILAELYIQRNDFEKAFDLGSQVYADNRFVRGLSNIILRSLKKMNKEYVEWAEEFLENNPNDIIALEMLSQYHLDNRAFEKAIKGKKQLYKLTNYVGYFIQERVCVVLSNPPLTGHIAEDVIMSYMPKDLALDIKIELNFQLGLIWWDLYKSPYKSYNYLKNVSCCYNNPRSVIASEKIMGLLKNHSYSKRIIKSKRDPFRLSNLRVKELINGIINLSKKIHGYNIWEDFIDQSQTLIQWRTSLKQRVIRDIVELDKENISELKEKSFLLSGRKDKMKAFQLVHSVKGNESTSANREFVVENSDKLIAISESPEEQIWLRYSYAILFVSSGKYQSSNNYAITLWMLANTIKNSERSELARCLGTLAWGICQFKNGKDIEGISAIISVLKVFVQLGEVGAFIEDGLEVINRWLSQKNFISESELKAFKIFYKQFTIHKDNTRSLISDLVVKGEWNEIYDSLGLNVYNPLKYDSNWAIDFHHFITASAKMDKVDLSLIINNYTNVISSLSTRLDVRPKILYILSDILLKESIKKDVLDVNILTCQKLLDVAVSDLENQRNLFKNTYERAFLSDSNRDVYLQYLQVNSMIITLRENENFKIFLNVFRAFNYLSFRTIKEKRLFNQDTVLSDELRKLEIEYDELLQKLIKKSLNKKEYSLDTYQRQTKRFLEIQKVLEEKHPSYKFDPCFKQVRIPQIQMKMQDSEVFYKYVKVELGFCYLLITKNEIETGYLPSDVYVETNVCSNLIKRFKEGSFSKETEELISDCNKISDFYFKPLLNRIDNVDNKYNVYISPDLSIQYLSSNLIRSKNKWLIENVKSIVNVIDYNYFIERDEEKRINFGVTTIGKGKDAQIIRARKWCDGFNFIDEFEVDIKKFNEKLNKENITGLIILGHGISETHNDKITGSISIEGNTRSWAIDEISEGIKELNLIVFITCSSGSLSFQEYETSNSIIAKILKEDISNVILCKWDVLLDPSLIIMQKMIEFYREGKNIQESLCMSIGNLLDENDLWRHPGCWAGIELWQN